MSAGAQMGLRFLLRWPNGRSEQLVVDAARALVGSAAHCEVRLSAETAAPERLEVVLHGGRVHVAARVYAGGRGGAGASGLPGDGIWPPHHVIVLGGVAVSVEAVDLLPRRSGRSPLWLFLPIPFAAIVAAFFFKASDEKMRIALAKRERSPFSIRDAVDAVPVFEQAAACFRAAAARDQLDETSNAAQLLRSRLNDEYRARRVRVEHAFRVADPFGARRELAVLIPMMSHRRGPYVDWMVAVNRYGVPRVRSVRRLVALCLQHCAGAAGDAQRRGAFAAMDAHHRARHPRHGLSGPPLPAAGGAPGADRSAGDGSCCAGRDKKMDLGPGWGDGPGGWRRRRAVSQGRGKGGPRPPTARTAGGAGDADGAGRRRAKGSARAGNRRSSRPAPPTTAGRHSEEAPGAA